MVAYSFKARFVEPILSGRKRQTIRAARTSHRSRHAEPGQQLQLYTGMRTKNCRLITRATCTAVLPVTLFFEDRQAKSFVLDRHVLPAPAMRVFAVSDGFGESGDPLADMAEFWFAEHGTASRDLRFDGVLIQWRRDSEEPC